MIEGQPKAWSHVACAYIPSPEPLPVSRPMTPRLARALAEYEAALREEQAKREQEIPQPTPDDKKHSMLDDMLISETLVAHGD